MGWKAFRDHYNIEYIVSINRGGNLSISSAYIRDIIVIRPDGTILEGHGKTDSKPINTLLDLLAREKDTVRSLIESPDTFEASIPVYTVHDRTVVEKFCETPGWPNCTHDGELMYDNQFYRRKADAIAHGVRQCESWIELLNNKIAQLTADLNDARSELAEFRSDLEALRQLSPESERSEPNVYRD